MTGIFADSAKPDRLISFSLLLIASAPLVFGCQPPWASGFLLSAVMLLASVFVLRQIRRGENWLAGSAALHWPVFLLLGWLVASVVRDALLGPQAEPASAPALSVHQLYYAGAFLGAVILGSAYAAGGERLEQIASGILVLGVVLALFALLQFWGWDVKKFGGWQEVTSRPSGLYTNANRFAVLMTLCWMCANALLLNKLLSRRSGHPRARVGIFALGGAVIVLSICVALTLSRLTIIAAAIAMLAVAVAWLILNRKQTPDEEFKYLSTAARMERVALVMLPLVVVAAWGAWCLIVGSSALRNRFAELQPNLALDTRFKAASIALPLIREQPVWGHGLGSFETAFATVQPENLEGRWRELHCDWLQLALEAGFPALILAAIIAGAWCLNVWRQLKFANERFLLHALPAAGILVFLLCSTADFPLREPASATLFFFVFGALISPSKTQSASRFSKSLGALVAIVLLLGAGFSVRNALAYASSPWLGRIYAPPPKAEQLAGWQHAAKLDPSDPELQFRLATAAFAAGTESNAQQVAIDAAHAAQRLNPLDHRFPWIEAAIAERAGDLQRAAQLREKAAARYPNNPTLREQNGRFYLSHDVLRRVPGEPERDVGLQHCLENFRIVLRCTPQREAALIDAMEIARCLNQEIAQLWQGDGEASRLRRARFYCSKDQWDGAERDLPKTEPAGISERRWYYGIRGTIAFRRGDVEAGREAWKRAVNGADGIFDGWLSAESSALGVSVCESLAGDLGPEMFKYPLLAGTLARKLIEDKHWASADNVLEKAAGASPELAAQWAELALQLGNVPAASQRARMAWEQGLFSPRWGNWYSQFQDRIRQHKER